VYKGLDIGSGKATPEERRGIPHHLIDIAEPTETFSVQQWLDAAERAIDDIKQRGAIPIVVGGTHLYIKAFLEGLFEGPDPDPVLRARLASLPADERRRELERIDPDAASRIHPNDDRRTIRALEVHRLTGTPISALQRQWDQGRTRRNTLLVGLDWPTDEINRRINARVKQMVERGLIAEARALWQSDRLGPTSREALGYKQLIDHFEGRSTLDDAVEQIKIETRRFAKNQRTWLRRLRTTPGSLWIDAASKTPDEWPNHVLERLERADGA
jgi:tRNA dimethylallyltransferase